MANTVIQLKYSSVTSQPPTLNTAEPAYSNVSGVLWIDDGTGVVPIGGKSYMDKIDAATSNATGNTIVKRDLTGNASFHYIFANNISGNITGQLVGNANTATKLETPRYIKISGDGSGESIFDGSANADITLDLSDTGVSAGTYGGSTHIPTFTVDVEGRLSYAANVSIATTLNVSADSGSNSVDLLTDTLNLAGGSGISTTSTGDTITIDVDNTVVRSNTAILNQTIDGSVTITGNLVVTGNVTSVDVTTLSVEDSLIALAKNNVTDSVDIGFYGHYNDGSNRHAGLMRHAGDQQFYIFDNYDQEPTANTINPSHASFRLATLHTNLTSNVANVTVANLGSLSLTNALTVPHGGTGKTTFTVGSILTGNSTGSLVELANTGTAGTYANANTIAVITTDTYGRVSGVTNVSIDIGTSQITSGILPISRGGTNNDTYTTGAAVFYDGAKISTLANTGTAGTYGEASRTLTVTTDAFGRVSSVSNNAIAIDTSQLISGTLGVARGGTGTSSFTVKGVIVSDTSSSTGALSSLTSSTEGHILQINSSGAPTFAHLNGGTF